MDRRAIIAVLLLLSIAGLVALPVDGPRPDGAEIGHVRVCPAAAGETAPPDFAGPACRTLPVNQADPQGRTIWLQAVFPTPGALLSPSRPLGLFVSASASSEAWLNGQFLGRNGRLGDAPATEVPGRLDGAIYVPPGTLRPGANTLVLRLSSHRGFLRLANPVQGIGFDDYARPTDLVLRRYWPSLATFGVFLLAALYFGAMAVRGDNRRGALILFLISLFAAGQLLAEAARGLFGYPYPLHDLRLVLIVVFSLGFGLCLAAHVGSRFMDRRLASTLAGLAAVAAVAIVAAPGFDEKAIAAVLIPTLAGVGGTGFWTWRRRPLAIYYFVALTAFAGLMLLAPGDFLNVRFFYAVAGLLLFPFLEEAGALGRERTLRQGHEERAQHLAVALDQARRGPAGEELTIKAAGRIERVAPDRISHCNGAGDYVELCFVQGGQTLHSISLNELAEALPPRFLRVHRSHIVNIAVVKSLTRLASGVGRLQLTNGVTVPVSRRIMPMLRIALDGRSAVRLADE